MIKFNINLMIIAEAPCTYCKVDEGLPCLTKRWNPRPQPHQERYNDYLKKKEKI
jgi:hypothetical protein